MASSNALVQEFVNAVAADEKEHVLRLLSEDCIWEVVPWGYTARGHREVTAFLGVASKTRTYKDTGQRIQINNWFTDGQYLCVELTNIASLSILPSVKARQRICLTLHIRGDKFDQVHEYFKAPFPISLIIRLVPFVARMHLRNQK